MAIREGAWDCPACGQKRNRGPEKHCGACGSPRGTDVKFYLPEDSQEITDEEELKKAKSGPDWNCQFCNGDNASYKAFCSGCGAGKDGSPPREVKFIPEGGESPVNEPVKEPVKDSTKESPKPSSTVTAKGAKGGCLALLMSFLLFMLIGCCCSSFFSKDTTVTVNGFKWERTVEIEKLKTIREKAWEGQVPAGADIISKSKEIYKYEKVQTGTETKTKIVKEKVKTGTKKVKTGVKDMGNGYFEDVYKDEPVYETREKEVRTEEPVYKEKPLYKQRITYEIDKWTVGRTEKKSGQDQKASWPNVNLRSKEREGKRTETYTVLCTDDQGKNLTYNAKSEQEWLSIEKGKTYKAKAAFDKVTEIVRE
jgi:hypothetical protein